MVVAAAASVPTTISPPSIESIARDDEDERINPATLAINLAIGLSAGLYVVWGFMLVTQINTETGGRKWFPEWYLNTGQSRMDKAKLGGWWFMAAVFWPVPVLDYVGRRLARRWKKGGNDGRVDLNAMPDFDGVL